MKPTASKIDWTSERILQIMPATGWYARYREDSGAMSVSPLQCFALVERFYPGNPPDDKLEQSVHGMDADETGHMDLSDGVSNFAGYIHESDPDFKRPVRVDI